MEIKDEKIKNRRPKWIFGTKLKNCPVTNPVAAGWIVTVLTTADFQRVMSWNIKARGWQEKINWRRISASKGYPKKTIRNSAQFFWGGTPENNYGFGTSNIKQNIENVTNQLNNNANNGQVTTNSDYTVNTESLVGKPSSYFQNNNSVFVNNNAGGFGNNNTSGANTTIGQQNNNVGSNNSIVQSITALNPINAGYQIGQKIGEFAADTKLAYDYWQKMNQTGNQLVTTFGSGQGADIDNYYHPLLQCELAKISPQSRNNGIALGYAKEYLMDYPKKRFLQHQSHDEIMKDSRKDLQNNLYGSNLGYNNPNRSCEDLLDDRRTPNMRKLGIR